MAASRSSLPLLAASAALALAAGSGRAQDSSSLEDAPARAERLLGSIAGKEWSRPAGQAQDRDAPLTVWILGTGAGTTERYLRRSSFPVLREKDSWSVSVDRLLWSNLERYGTRESAFTELRMKVFGGTASLPEAVAYNAFDRQFRASARAAARLIDALLDCLDGNR